MIPRPYHAFYKALPHGRVITEECDYLDKSDDKIQV